MPTSDTDIANRALRLLKGQRIDNIDDGTSNANKVKDVFSSVREEMLRAHTWKFATKLTSLARLSATPAFQYDYAYSLPDDWIRTISVHDNDAGTGIVNYEEASIDGGGGQVGAILASREQIYLRYVYRLTDPNRMPPDFQTAFAYALAVQIPGVPNLSAATWASLERNATRKLNRAKSADALSSPPRRRPRGSWADSRQSWPSGGWPR